jgi:hypothetical protein
MAMHEWKIHILVWKRVVPKLLPLFGKAKKLAMWSYVATFAYFSDAEMAWAQQFDSINELIHGRGALIDLIWMTFVRTIMDQSDDIETWMLKTCVEAIVSEYPGVRRSASRWIQNKGNEIRRNIGNTYTDEEAESDIHDLGVTESCLEETDRLFTEDNIDNIVADGMKLLEVQQPSCEQSHWRACHRWPRCQVCRSAEQRTRSDHGSEIRNGREPPDRGLKTSSFAMDSR